MDIRGVRAQVTALEPLPAPQEAAALEHVLCVRVQGPVVALSRPPRLSGDLDEAVVESQIMTDGVLPFFGIVSVEGEALCDELVDSTQRQLAVGGVGYGHGNQRDVAVGGFPSLERSLPPPTSGLLL